MTDDDERHLAADVMQAYLSEAIRRGQIDPRGKTDADLVGDIRRLLTDLPSSLRWLTLIDHRPMLLAEARRCVRRRFFGLAGLLYATWTVRVPKILISPFPEILITCR